MSIHGCRWPSVGDSLAQRFPQAALHLFVAVGHRYWFEDEENARIMQQNAQYQQVDSYEQMIALTYLAPEETSEDADFL